MREKTAYVTEKREKKQSARVRETCLHAINVIVQYLDAKSTSELREVVQKRILDKDKKVRLVAVAMVSGQRQNSDHRYFFPKKKNKYLITYKSLQMRANFEEQVHRQDLEHNLELKPSKKKNPSIDNIINYDASRVGETAGTNGC